MLLSLDKLYPQLSYAQKNGLFEGLNSIYSGLPETACDRCGTCCTVPPPAYIIEYLNMFRYMKENLSDLIPSLLEKAVRFYFLELVDINLKCPFLGEENLCLVYPVRPLSCRGYGLAKKGNFGGDRGEMEELARRYKEKYGIILPAEVVGFKLPECGKVRVVDGRKASAELLEVAVSYVAQLESRLFPVELVDKEYTFVPFVTHLALTVLSEGARIRRPKVMKEYLETGGSAMLNGFIEKAKQVSL
ncbi:MAG: YkgJ family cysteine cluster protein [Peptococcaceae bacterium]|nr:YkgJ family cysteine cluster protein [Peptococcaceae bacterium]